MTNRSINKAVRIQNGIVVVNGNEVFFQTPNSELNSFCKEVYQHLGISYGKFFKMDGLSKLGFIAAEILLQGNENQYNDNQTGLVLMNRSSSLNTDVKFQETLSEIPSPAVFVYTLPNIVMGEISIRNNFKGEGAFFVQQEWDIDFNIDYVSTLFASTPTKQVLTGWLEVDKEGVYNACLMLVTSSMSEYSFNKENVLKLFK
jgi:hypothetical protein